MMRPRNDAGATPVYDLARMPTSTPQELCHYAVQLYNAGLIRAASSLFCELHIHNPTNSTLSHFIVQCGIMLRDIDMILRVDLRLVPIPTRHLASLVANTALHTRMRDAAVQAVASARAVEVTTAPRVCGEDWVLVIPAGGTDLVAQLWCNLQSLRECQQRGGTIVAPSRIIIAHASDEWTDMRKAAFIDEFGRTLEFLDLNTVIVDVNVRGFQIKLAALAYVLDAYASSVSAIVLSDADILWVRHPSCGVIRSGALSQSVRIGIFRDLWHSVHKRHEKSASTAFIRDFYGVGRCDGYELESGVVCVTLPGASSDEREPAALASALWHLFHHHAYYFSLAYGDKDLFDIASHLALGVKCRRLGYASMIGYISDDKRDVRLHSMLQYFDRSIGIGLPYGLGESHVHSTLLPATESSIDEPPDPTHECVDTSKVSFVTQDGKGTISVSAQEMRPLPYAAARLFKKMRREWLPAFRNQMHCV